MPRVKSKQGKMGMVEQEQQGGMGLVESKEHDEGPSAESKRGKMDNPPGKGGWVRLRGKSRYRRMGMVKSKVQGRMAMVEG